MPGTLWIEQTDKARLDRRIQIVVEESLPMFHVNQSHHLFYGQFMISQQADQLMYAGIMGHELVRYLSGQLVRYLSGQPLGRRNDEIAVLEFVVFIQQQIAEEFFQVFEPCTPMETRSFFVSTQLDTVFFNQLQSLRRGPIFLL